MQATKNEKRLSGMQATEIPKPEKPEFSKTEFLKVKFKNEFEFLKVEQQAQQTVLAKHQQRLQTSRMKGGSSFASKCQPSSVEEECLTAKERFDKIYYDETTGAVLDPKLVAAAVQEELDFMRQLKVYHEVPADFAAQVSDQSGHAGSTRTRVTPRTRRSEHAWWRKRRSETVI